MSQDHSPNADPSGIDGGFDPADALGEDLSLSADDAAALDALLRRGLGHGAGDQSETSDREEQLERLFGLLGAESLQPDPSLVDLTMVAISRVREPELIAGDAEALDALALVDWRPDRVASGSLRARAHRHAGLRSAAAETPIEAVPAADLVERTMQAIQSRERAAQPIPFEAPRATLKTRLQDVISVAAVLLLGFSVLWPVMGSLREQSRQALCNSNFAAAGFGVGSYAAANDDQLPMASAGLGGLPWWNVGQGPEQSNSANLFVLPRTGYVPLADLACPGNALAPTALTPRDRDWRRLDEVSYSYRIMFGPTRPGIHASARFVVMTDRSPVVLRAIAGNPVNPYENSPNHGGRGQHVLWNDGSAEWVDGTELPSGDNIWLPCAIEDEIRRVEGRPSRIDPIAGTELPGGISDAFVGP